MPITRQTVEIVQLPNGITGRDPYENTSKRVAAATGNSCSDAQWFAPRPLKHPNPYKKHHQGI